MINEQEVVKKKSLIFQEEAASLTKRDKSVDYVFWGVW